MKFAVRFWRLWTSGAAQLRPPDFNVTESFLFLHGKLETLTGNNNGIRKPSNTDSSDCLSSGCDICFVYVHSYRS